jgi:ABC-type branched-subunit amino acid transport system substrate-binding protein
MSRGRKTRLLLRNALVSALLLALSACQSGNDVAEVLDPRTTADDQAVAQAPTTPQKSMTLGQGSVRVAMLLPLSAPGSVGDEGRKMRDGARLAMADMGNDLITLTIEDTRGDPKLAGKMTLEAMGSGAKAVIGPTELAAAKRLTQVSGDKRPPVLALAENFAGSPGIYSVRLSEADSAAAAAAALAAKGKRKFVLFVAEGGDAEATKKRVANSLSIYGAQLVMTLPYRTAGGGAEKAVSDMAALIDKPEAVIVASGSTNPSAIISPLRTHGLLGKGAALIGTSRWLTRPLNDPLLEGAYIAALDDSETGPIASRFKATFNYDADVNVAYAYDMVALTAGIASAAGPKGLTRKVLENKTGFRGSTGLFRFRPDGASERSMPFYQIKNGSLKEIEKSISGF